MVALDYSIDEEVLDLTCKFKKFLMNNKKRSGDVWGSVKNAKFQETLYVEIF